MTGRIDTLLALELDRQHLEELLREWAQDAEIELQQDYSVWIGAPDLYLEAEACREFEAWLEVQMGLWVPGEKP